MLRRLQGAARAVAALDDDLRRKMYLFVRSRRSPVSREEAARHVGISRKLAAFHLDKLVERGLLTAHYARPPGRAGSVGRPSKLYEPSRLEVEVSIPERRYDLVGEILVEALERAPGAQGKDAAGRAAFERGFEVGRGVRERLRLRPPGPERALAVAEEALSDYGFEPFRESPSVLALRNCPFDRLARTAPELVCGLNREFIDGLLRGLGNDTVEAALEPHRGRCCVVLRARADR